MSSKNTRQTERRDLLALTGASALSALLLTLAFPPAELSFLAWFALAPMLVALRVRWGKLGLLTLCLTGMAYGALGFSWARHVTWLGMFLLGLYLSVYWIVFAALTRWLSFRRGLPLALVAPVTWTALECIRGVALTGLPWLFLSHTQYRALPVIQIADVTGAAGVTFWLVACNGLVADVICLLRGWEPGSRRRRTLAAGLGVLALCAASLGYGLYRLETIVVEEGPPVAATQGNIPQSVKKVVTEDTFRDMFHTYLGLTIQALAAPEPPHLILWPETMARPYMFDSRNNWDRLNNRPRMNRWVLALSKHQRNADLLISANSGPDPETRPDYNSVFLLPRGGKGTARPDGRTTARYDKIHLVPFGEYVPLKKLIGWIVGPMVPYQFGMAPGSEHVLYEVSNAPGWHYAPTICFEDAFPSLVADFGRGDRHMDFIVNLTNEGWFLDGTELDQHLAIAVFRAVECRAGFIRSANTGISAFVSPTGEIVSTLVVDGKDRQVKGVLHGVAMRTQSTSPYLVVGELFGTLCVVGLFCMILPGWPGIRKWGRGRRTD